MRCPARALPALVKAVRTRHPFSLTEGGLRDGRAHHKPAARASCACGHCSPGFPPLTVCQGHWLDFFNIPSSLLCASLAGGSGTQDSCACPRAGHAPLPTAATPELREAREGGAWRKGDLCLQ